MGVGIWSGGRVGCSGSNSGSGIVITGGAMYEKYLHGTTGTDCKEEVEAEGDIDGEVESKVEEEGEVGSV